MNMSNGVDKEGRPFLGFYWSQQEVPLMHHNLESPLPRFSELRENTAYPSIELHEKYESLVYRQLSVGTDHYSLQVCWEGVTPNAG